MSGTTMIILSAFVVYLLFMIVIGVVYMKKTNSSEDYFLGGRGLNAWVAALSAQASDMSGWLLMGLPGAIFYRSIVMVMQNMGYMIVAEGAETEEEVNLLRSWGVDMVQGYYFSRPLPEKELLKLF